MRFHGFHGSVGPSALVLGSKQEACCLCQPVLPLLLMEQSKRRKKTASERRQQRVRAEGRRLQHAIGAMHAVHSHRGGQLTSLGNALLQALQQMGEAPTKMPTAPASPYADWVGTQREVHHHHGPVVLL